MASDSDNPSNISPCTANIPDDIIEEILIRVPVKTLIQFKRVCKLWNSVISSPIFASLQLNSTVGKPPSAVLQAERVMVSSQPPRHINFIDIIHGVVCAAYSWSPISAAAATLWNPLICKYVDVPWPPQIVSSADQPQQDFISGFGFDHSRNDFKVILILAKDNPIVFSVRDGIWRNPVNHGIAYDSAILPNQSSCFLNGNIHWITSAYKLLLFDCERGEFGNMDLPQGIRSNESAPKALRTYDGLFAVLKFTSWRYCEMWEMKRYGVGSSWSKLRCFGEGIGCERLSFAFQGTMLLADVEDAREAEPGGWFFWESGWKIGLMEIDKADAWWVGNFRWNVRLIS